MIAKQLCCLVGNTNWHCLHCQKCAVIHWYKQVLFSVTFDSAVYATRPSTQLSSQMLILSFECCYFCVAKLEDSVLCLPKLWRVNFQCQCRLLLTRAHWDYSKTVYSLIVSKHLPFHWEQWSWWFACSIPNAALWNSPKRMPSLNLPEL